MYAIAPIAAVPPQRYDHRIVVDDAIRERNDRVKYFVALAGNIGAGKSSLTSRLAQRLGWEPIFEKATENPYLTDFYQNIPRWSFHSQMFFLTSQLRNYRTLIDCGSSVVQDRTIYEDGEIFAFNLYKNGYMSERDWSLYRNLYESLVSLLPLPHLVVYLRASVPTLMHRIAQRGEESDLNISQGYLAELNELYEDWVDGFNLCPLLTITTDDVDFMHCDEHFELIVQHVLNRVSGTNSEG